MSKVNNLQQLIKVQFTLYLFCFISGLIGSILTRNVFTFILTLMFIAPFILTLRIYFQGKKTENVQAVSINNDIIDSRKHLELLESHLDNSVRSKLEVIPVLSEQLQAVINQTDDAAGEITGAFIGINSMAKKQLNAVQTLFGNLSSQSTGDNFLSQTQSNLEEIKSNFSVLTSFFDKTISMISDVDAQLGKVDSFASDIDNIGKVTNILALNASIQAVHSGEAGQGFKVIASEINTLSKNSTKSIHQITGITTDLKNKVNAIKKEFETVYEQSQVIENRTNELFNEISDKIGVTLQEVAEKVNVIAGDAEHLTKEVSKIVVSIQFQDITRQRIEHVITPLSTIKNDLIETIDKIIKKELDFADSNSGASRDALLNQYTMESEREILNKHTNKN